MNLLNPTKGRAWWKLRNYTYLAVGKTMTLIANIDDACIV